MRQFTQSLTVMGRITATEPNAGYFRIKCRSNDYFDAYVTLQTWFDVLRNLDGLGNDRVVGFPGFDGSSVSKLIEKYLYVDQLVVVEGVLQFDDDRRRYDARTIHLLGSLPDRFLFEEPQWWVTQTATLADQWLDSLFGDKRSYEVDDWVQLYRTNLNILGLPSDDTIQECAVLSRLIYGLSAAYLIVGNDRYRRAADSAVRFQRDAFRILSQDGQCCVWASGRRRNKYGTDLLVPSQFADDAGSIPLYEQIYALAGLANYYRISLDAEVLNDIRRTIQTFNKYYLDESRPGDAAFRAYGGYFSHLDYVTMRPDQNVNPANNLKKNWNSVGDHIPAYLINLLLSLDPLPSGTTPDAAELLAVGRALLDRVTTLILEKFPDPDPRIPYVNERFFADWSPDHTYGWQQNRAIIGHNFKIAWNLTRVANYYETMAQGLWRRSTKRRQAESQRYRALASRCMSLAERLGESMTQVGIDQIRGGCFDAVERVPYGGADVMPVEFTWSNTKDFWQQEQAILAYLILFGHTGKQSYLDMARQTEAFWNIFFLDREHRGMYFRVTDNGLPVIQGGYAVRGGHSDASGYHCFELNYLAHIYNRSYVSLANGTEASFCLHFKPDRNCKMRSINVLPDFMPPDRIQIERVTIEGSARQHPDPDRFQIELSEDDLGGEIVVQFRVINPPPQPR